jgi:hypothetical protein
MGKWLRHAKTELEFSWSRTMHPFVVYSERHPGQGYWELHVECRSRYDAQMLCDVLRGAGLEALVMGPLEQGGDPRE